MSRRCSAGSWCMMLRGASGFGRGRWPGTQHWSAPGRARGRAHCHVRIGPPVLFLEWFGDYGENLGPMPGTHALEGAADRWQGAGVADQQVTAPRRRWCCRCRHLIRRGRRRHRVAARTSSRSSNRPGEDPGLL
jgi:hypothetical protein